MGSNLHMIDKQLIIGLGTGRCGTMSLSKLLTKQPHFHVTHEHGEILPWLITPERFDVKLQAMYNRHAHFVGDVASYYLPYTDYIIDKTLGNVKFIILKRDVEEVCDSFMRKTPGRNHWQTGPGRRCRWDQAFPKFEEAHDKREAIRSYYNQYYELCEDIPIEHKYVINTSDLNVSVQCIQMLAWLGIKQPVYAKIHSNKI